MEKEMRELYESLLLAWNRRSAEAMAALFLEDGYTIGFDGSTHAGPAEIRDQVGAVFQGHRTAAFVAKVRRMVALGPEVAVLNGVAGMVPPGAADINPAVNAVQTLVAARRGGSWPAGWGSPRWPRPVSW